MKAILPDVFKIDVFPDVLWSTPAFEFLLITPNPLLWLTPC